MKLWILLATVAVFSSAYAESEIKIINFFFSKLINFCNFLEKVVCYWGTWAVYRQGHGKFEVTDINPTLCTHFIYTFLKASPDGRVDYYDPYLDLSDNYGKGKLSTSESVKILIFDFAR